MSKRRQKKVDVSLCRYIDVYKSLFPWMPEGGDNHLFGAKTKISIKCWKYNTDTRNFTGAFFVLFFII